VEALKAGNFQWANTATLVGTGLVEQKGEMYTWNPSAFDEDGKLRSVSIQDPTNENCAQCHGVVHTSEAPLTIAGCDLSDWQTATTGQVMARRNFTGDESVRQGNPTRLFDIHTERGVTGTDCHYAFNNPVYYQAGMSL
jgi:hypothetical protein